MSDSVPPQRRQPTRLPCPWDSLGKNTRVGFHFLLQCVKVKSESEVAQLCPTFVTSWTAAHEAPPSIGFSSKSTGAGCCQEPAWRIPPVEKVMRKRPDRAKARSGLKGPSLGFLEHLPPNQSLSAVLYYAFHQLF